MLSNTERGKAFQLLCRDALKRALSRDFDLEVPIDVAGKLHKFDLASPERNTVVECKAIKFTKGENNPSAKITTLREAVMYLRAAQGNPARLLIIKHDPHPKRKETLGQYFVRLNRHMLEGVTVLEMPETGGELVCIHGTFGAAKARDA
jgi:hypothetical protein